MKTKLTPWDKVVGFFSARSQLERTQMRAAAALIQRKYEGAGSGRRTKNWKAPASSVNSEVESSIVTLRNRARQLVRDNPYSARGIQVITANVVGKGIVAQIKVDSGQNNSTGVNTSVNRRQKDLTRAWQAWALTPAIDYDGRNNLYGLQRLIMRSVAESGEVLVRLRRTQRRRVWSPDGVEVEIPPVQIQVLEGDFLDINGFGSSRAQSGNVILNGIEFDKSGNRLAYHIYEEHPGNSSAGFGASLKSAFATVRVPANEVAHVFRVDRPGQIRGVPWLAPVMIRLKDFDLFEDAHLVRQQIAAMFAVFVKDIDGVDSALALDDAELGSKVEPGIIEVLPPGKSVEFANPPGVQGYREYVTTILHSIAAGLGVTYESLTNDLSGVNFSSGRMGHLEMQRNIDEWRCDILQTQFMDPLFNWFTDAMELLGFDVSRARVEYTAPRREMIDPSKEIAAMKEAVRSGFMTISEVVKAAGYDPDKHFLALAEDNAKLDAFGLVLDSDPRQDKKAAPVASDSGAPDDAAGEDSES